MAPLGRAALLLTFGLVLYALIAGAIGARQRRRRLALSARNALYAAFGTTAVAALVLLRALARRDFSFTYVAEHTDPVHARAPAASLPRVRRPDRAVRVRDGRAPLEADRRALDRRHAPLDARRVDVPRRRPAPGRALGVRRDRLGRLLRLGSG